MLYAMYRVIGRNVNAFDAGTSVLTGALSSFTQCNDRSSKSSDDFTYDDDLINEDEGSNYDDDFSGASHNGENDDTLVQSDSVREKV